MRAWEDKLRVYFKNVEDILPSNFDPKKDLDDIGHRIYDTMTNAFEELKNNNR